MSGSLVDRYVVEALEDGLTLSRLLLQGNDQLGPPTSIGGIPIRGDKLALGGFGSEAVTTKRLVSRAQNWLRRSATCLILEHPLGRPDDAALLGTNFFRFENEVYLFWRRDDSATALLRMIGTASALTLRGIVAEGMAAGLPKELWAADLTQLEALALAATWVLIGAHDGEDVLAFPRDRRVFTDGSD